MSLPTRTFQRIDRLVEGLWKRLPEVVFWVFLVGSVAYLGQIGAGEIMNRGVGGAPGTTNAYTFVINSGAESWAAPGLTYEGITGVILALAQASAVALGAFLLFARRLRRRIIGSMLVVGWAALWAANAAAFAGKSGGSAGDWMMALAYALPLVASMIVAMRRMGAGGRGRGGVMRRTPPRLRRREAPKTPTIPPPPARLRGERGTAAAVA